MPYGMPKDLGELDAKVERCVASLMDKGKDKQSAIRICKAAVIEAAKKESGGGSRS